MIFVIVCICLYVYLYVWIQDTTEDQHCLLMWSILSKYFNYNYNYNYKMVKFVSSNTYARELIYHREIKGLSARILE